MSGHPSWFLQIWCMHYSLDWTWWRSSSSGFIFLIGLKNIVYMSILNPNKKQVMWIIHCMLDQVHFGKEALKNLKGWQLLFKLMKLWKNTQHGFWIDTLFWFLSIIRTCSFIWNGRNKFLTNLQIFGFISTESLYRSEPYFKVISNQVCVSKDRHLAESIQNPSKSRF